MGIQRLLQAEAVQFGSVHCSLEGEPGLTFYSESPGIHIPLLERKTGVGVEGVCVIIICSLLVGGMGVCLFAPGEFCPSLRLSEGLYSP